MLLAKVGLEFSSSSSQNNAFLDISPHGRVSGGQCVMRICIYMTWVQNLALTLKSWLSWASEVNFLVSVSSSLKLS